MNRGTEILKEAKTIREGRESLDIVRQPWFSWRAPSMPIICTLIFLCTFLGAVFGPKSFRSQEYWYGAWFIVLGIVSWINQRHRDRTWRRLIEIEAPELHRKITDKTEA